MYIQKKEALGLPFLRKARDSNPRIREDRRLSKPLHSTTLPAFHAAKV